MLLRLALLATVLALVAGQTIHVPCNGHGTLQNGTCVCDQFYKDAERAFHVIHWGDGKCWGHRQEVAHNAGGYGGNDWPNSIVLERDCTVGITWTLTDDGAFRASHGVPDSQLGQCVGWGSNHGCGQQLQLLPCDSGSVARGCNVNTDPHIVSCSAGAIVNCGGTATAAELTPLVRVGGHSDVSRVWSQMSVFEDQRCAEYDASVVSTTTTTTATSTTTTTQTATSHTAFSDITRTVDAILIEQSRLRRQVDTLTTSQSTLRAEKDALQAHVSAMDTAHTAVAADLSRLRASVARAVSGLRSVNGSTAGCGSSDAGLVPCSPAVRAEAANLWLSTPGGTVTIDTASCGSVDVCDIVESLHRLSAMSAP